MPSWRRGGWRSRRVSSFPPCPWMSDTDFPRVSSENWYSLTPRALMELTSYLTQTYNTPADDSDNESESGTRSGAVVERIKNCHGCKEIITVGFRCQTKTCGFRLHDLCATQYFRAQRGLKECPTCGAAWAAKDPVGEKAARSGALGVGRAGGGGGRRVSSNNTQDGRGRGRGRDGAVAQAQAQARSIDETEAEEEEEEEEGDGGEEGEAERGGEEEGEDTD